MNANLEIDDYLVAMLILGALLVIILSLYSHAVLSPNKTVTSKPSGTTFGDEVGVIPFLHKPEGNFLQCTAKKLLRPEGTGECR
jgi:hypothetical protein